ncbi:MAG: bifunctional phosphopantothenoylcysteine decarboxylase/phosphopantothenate--cysteine ligase CoaBC [Chloroflexota bacterium]
MAVSVAVYLAPVKEIAITNHPHVVLGVTGSIAAFKAATLAGELVAHGFDVRAVLTETATRFVTPLTFEALTGNQAATGQWDEPGRGSRMIHIELGTWADVVAVVPATATTIARLSLGLADDLLGALILSTPAPLIVAPAMETGMWSHPATQEHVKTLRARGVRIVGPSEGRLASGTHGEGRMSEPAAILEAIRQTARRRSSLHGLRALVTAGPTHEPIDPVRYIGNRSSGKMGYALAQEALDRGAEVVLIAGPTALASPPGAEVVTIETTRDMQAAVLERAGASDIVIMAAAVADFSPACVLPSKLKRDAGFQLTMQPTKDIARAASEAAPDALHIGFALETEDLLNAARLKLRRKGQALVVANAVSDGHGPFGSDVNHVLLVHEGDVVELPEMSKVNVAAAVWDDIERLLAARGKLPG